MKRHNRLFIAGIFIVALLIAFLIAGRNAVTRAQESNLLPQWLTQLLKPVAGGEESIALANGAPIQLTQLERQKQVFMLNGLDEASAYRNAFNVVVRGEVLAQEAKKRGFSATLREAQDYRSQVQQAIPATEREEFQKQIMQASGLSAEEYNAQELQAYQKILLVNKLTQALSHEAPMPTPEEIDAYLAQQPGPNSLVLIPIEFQDSTTAHATFEELQKLHAQQSANQFTTTFDGYARQLGHFGPTDFVHKKFNYANPETELPDYARKAASTPENDIGLFERADGTAVVYLVLKSQLVANQDVRDAATATLLQVKEQAYMFEVEKKLVQASDVRISYDNLPAAARSALASWSVADYGLPVLPIPSDDSTTPQAP